MPESSPANRRSAIVLLFTMVLLGVFPVDVVLPSFAALSNHFNRPQSDIAFSVSLFAMVIALSQLLIGPLSDRLGRKRLLLAGMLVAIIGAIGCVLATHFTVFMLFRCVQALGCGVFVLAQALVQDLFIDKQREPLRIAMITASGLFISLSPLAGTLLQQVFDWPGSFWVFVILASGVFAKAVFFLENPRPAQHVSHGIVQSYLHVCRNPAFIGYWLISGFAFACHFSFIVMSPLLFMEYLQLSPYAFSMVLLVYGTAYLGGGIVAQLISNWLAASTQITAGLLLILASGLLMLALSSTFDLSTVSVLVPMMICTVGITITRPVTTSKAMDLFPQHAGTAASTGGLLVLACGGAISALVNISATDLPTTLATSFIVLSTVSVIVHLLINRRSASLLPE